MTDIDIAVGGADGQVPLARAVDLVAAAGPEPAVRLRDRTGDDPALDPSLVAAYLAGALPDTVRPRFLLDAPTTRNAPFNLARRIQSVHRATGGHTGLVLHTGDGDEVSDTVAGEEPASPDDRWSEYAQVLTGLWGTFPAEALVGDQESGVAVDESLITPLNHRGRHYRVAGPLDGPADPSGPPPLFAVDGDGALREVTP